MVHAGAKEATSSQIKKALNLGEIADEKISAVSGTLIGEISKVTSNSSGFMPTF